MNPLIFILSSSSFTDPIAQDIRDIPRICRQIQDDWRGFGKKTSLNRLTAWNFTKCLQKRMQSLQNQSVERQSGTIDILLTGCEVSLWYETISIVLCLYFLSINNVPLNAHLSFLGNSGWLNNLRQISKRRSHACESLPLAVTSCLASLDKIWTAPP